MRPFAALFIVLAGLSGCATQRPLYSWGQYENLIYSSYAKPGAFPPEKQIENLERDYQVARSKNLPVPPGWHAHLGFLYYQIGNLDQARQEFETEKSTFPESTTLMNRLLAKLKKS